jgi:hypothetical protein
VNAYDRYLKPLPRPNGNGMRNKPAGRQNATAALPRKDAYFRHHWRITEPPPEWDFHGQQEGHEPEDSDDTDCEKTDGR